MFSIVCVYDNENVLSEWLLTGLNLQTVQCERILLDNSMSRFSSAAEALNYGGALATGDYIMFVHQDVSLNETTWLQNAEGLLCNLNNLGVAGVAAISPKIRDRTLNQRNLLKHGYPPKFWGNHLDQPETVQVVDELLFIVPKPVFNLYKLDQTTCPGWHLYAVDYCLSTLHAGFDNYVLPLPVWHKSTGGGPETPLDILLNYGTMPKDYYKALQPVLTKHRKQCVNIFTTCGIWNTTQPVFLQRSEKLFVQIIRYISQKVASILQKLLRRTEG